MTILNRTIFTRDNLEVLRGMNTGSVDLVYLDPPFNSRKPWSAPIGSKAAGAAFKDTWTLSDIDVLDHELLRASNPKLHDVVLAGNAAGGKATMSYLMYMSVRLVELRRVLKPSGSLYLHCDPTESHSLKLMLDVLFGREMFRNEIVWKRTSGKSNVRKKFGSVTDRVLFYSGQPINTEDLKVPFEEEYIRKRYIYDDEDGRGPYMTDNLRPPTPSGGYDYELAGVEGPWRFKEQKMLELHQDRRIWMRKGRVPRRKIYLSETKGRVPTDLWDDIPPVNSQALDDTGYPTQKPVDLMKRIIQASSNEGDVVLDPFCGCATTAIAAEALGRQWVGIDLSVKAVELVNLRLREDLDLDIVATHRTDVPARTDLGKLPKPSTHKQGLYGEQGGDCNGCGTHFRIVDFHIDHIVPKSKGGTDVRSNLQLLCGNCNLRKGKGTMSALMTKLLADRGIR